jgi:DNA primase catalytic core
MARIPNDELEKLKTTIDLSRLVEAKGVDLKKKGHDLVGRCPFHEGDNEPSLVVTPAKNLWHCFGCGSGGDVVQWVMKAEGVSFRHAIELLRAGADVSGAVVKVGTVRKLAAPVERDAGDSDQLGQVASYYNACLLKEAEALAYVVEKRGISRDAIDHFRIGFCNRTLGLRLPHKNRVDGEAVRARLTKLGVLRESGHEHLRGCITIPLVDVDGRFVGLYGRKIDNASKPHHLYLPGPHRGVFNIDGFKESREVVLCESLIDALTFWSAGIRNVTTSYGIEGFTGELLSTLKASTVERVLVAYDRDDAGDRGAEALMPKLLAEGFSVARIQFPRGMDANEYALKVQPAEKSLRLVVDKAAFVGQGTRTSSTTPTVVAVETEAAKGKMIEPLPLAASAAPSTTPAPATPAPSTTPAPPTKPAELQAESIEADELVAVSGGRRWRVRGIHKNLSREVLKVNVHVAGDGGFHVDNLDLYAARQRFVFLKHAAHELAVDEDTLKKDLGQLLVLVEEQNDAAIKETLSPTKTEAPPMDAAAAAEAMAFLKSPDLLDQVLRDFEACGVVGEETNKLVGYLAAVSRKLDDPLAIVIQSSSAAGKSSLMESVLAFVPVWMAAEIRSELTVLA